MSLKIDMKNIQHGKVFVILVLLLGVMLSWWFVLGKNHQAIQTEIIKIPEHIYIPITVVMTIPVPVVAEVPVIKYDRTIITVEKDTPSEKVVYRNISSREFESISQFETWYSVQDFRILMPSSDYKVDCDDYALAVQLRALEQGYLISVQLVETGYLWGVKVSEPYHMGNLVIINNDIYYVEPQPNKFKVVKIISRD